MKKLIKKACVVVKNYSIAAFNFCVDIGLNFIFFWLAVFALMLAACFLRDRGKINRAPMVSEEWL